MSACAHMDADETGWWCGCGDAIADEQHHAFGCCAVCADLDPESVKQCFGFVCQRCGLSDYGRERMRSNGFSPRPCPDCAEHFRQRDEEAER